jgi:hypothetical protein
MKSLLNTSTTLADSENFENFTKCFLRDCKLLKNIDKNGFQISIKILFLPLTNLK